MAPRCREEPSRSNFRPFSERNSVVNINAKIANGILDIRMTQQYLNGSNIAGRFVDQ
jgi:hypothetical protein